MTNAINLTPFERIAITMALRDRITASWRECFIYRERDGLNSPDARLMEQVILNSIHAYNKVDAHGFDIWFATLKMRTRTGLADILDREGGI